MKWINATDRLPKKAGKENSVVIRGEGFATMGYKNFDEINPEFYYLYNGLSFLGNKGIQWLDESNEPEIDMTKITRFEVINHKHNDNPFGRAFGDYDVNAIELSYQDNNKTLKVFLN